MTYGTLITTVTVGVGGAASIDFNSIPQTYADLLIVLSGRIVATSDSPSAQIAFNGSGTGYTARYLLGNGSTASAGTQTVGYTGPIDGSVQTTNTFSNTHIYITNYAGNANKNFSVDNVNETNATAAFQTIVADLWSNTAAITSASITSGGGNFAQYSSASIYGIK